MPKYTSNAITIIDNLDNINLELFVSTNLPNTQILNSDGTITPSWVTTPLVLTPSVYLRNQMMNNPTISWERRSGAEEYTSTFITGESVSNGVLTVNANVLANDPNKIITYKCTATYGALLRSVEITYALNIVGHNGRDGVDGASVSILGTAYINGKITECVVGANYTLYSDSALTTQIINPSIGDSYLVQGHLFVYSGAENDQFNYVGNIKGVGIASITGPVSNGLIDVYTIHYSDGTQTTYQVTNGKNGENAKTLNLYASKYTIAYNANGTLKDASPIILTVNQQNSTSEIIWATSDGVSLTGSGKTRSLAPTVFNNKDSVQIMVSADGLSDTITIVKVQDGVVGDKGSSGDSVFVTYHDSINAPADPTGEGDTNGWHRNMTTGVIWMSVKTAANLSSGSWGAPVRVKGLDGAAASLVNIVPSALYFKSTTGKNGIFTPEYIYLYPRFQSVTYSNWQYSVNGGVTWVSASGANGLTINTYNSIANSLRISRNSTLYTDSITSISFRCNTTDSTIYDILSIAKIYDSVDLQINDFVIEQGPANGWTYRKWANGIAECWRKVNFQGSTTTSDLTINLPFTFVSNDYLVQLTPSINGSIVNKYYVGDKMASEGRTTTHLKIAHQTNDNSNSVLYFIYVTGLWK